MRPIFVALAACLAGACIMHVSDFWRYGWLPYRFAPLPLNVYWTSLAFLDALAALLLLSSPRMGLLLAQLIIISDVALNLFARFGLGLPMRPLPLLLQILFLIAVVGATIHARRQGGMAKTI